LTLIGSEDAKSHAMFGTRNPPSEKWTWIDTGRVFQNPDWIELGGGTYYAGRGFIDGAPKIIVGYLTVPGQAVPLVVLPSGGDMGGPALMDSQDGGLLVFYHSSHEGKTAIYLATLD